MPQRGVVEGGAVSFRTAKGGHFVIEAEINGVALRLLVDTGASDLVLSPADARRLGFDVAALDYSRRYRTANGIVFGAPVMLGRVRVGPIALDDVRASVNGAKMARSLLGMSFLGRLSGYEVSDDTLTLKP
jgi:aspartyl protease family protein